MTGRRPWLVLLAAALAGAPSGGAEPAPRAEDPAAQEAGETREPGGDDTTPDPAEEETGEEQEEEVFGRRSSIRFDAAATDTLRAEAGWPLLQLPHPRARRLAAIAESIELPVLERRDGWARVEYRGWKGWLPIGGPRPEPLPEGATAPPAQAVMPPAAARLPRFAPPAERLTRLLEMLGERGTSGAIGPYALHTDVRDAELLERLDGIAAGLAGTYRERFGLDPGEVEGETVVLFADESAYRAYEADLLGLAGLDTLGHSGNGLSVIFVGDLSRAQIEQIAIHELTHLLNRRALGFQVAPWLEEGLAEDLGFSRVDAKGRIVVGSIAGGRRFEGTLVARRGLEMHTTSGPLASLVALLAMWSTDSRPPLAEFVEIPPGRFLRPEVREIYYAQSALFVRFLLDGRKGRLTERFRSFLQQVAAGGASGGEALWRHLDADPRELERSFYAWVTSRANSLGIVVAR